MSRSGGQPGHTVQDEGSSLPVQPILDFQGAGVTAADGSGKTVVTIPGGGSASDASTTVKGIIKTSVAPSSAANPIAVGDNDTRVSPQVTGSTANLGATSTVDFQSIPREMWLAGTLNANHAVTVSNPVTGSRLRFIAAQDGTGGRTLTIAGQSVSIPTTATTGLAMVLAVWLDASTFRIESAGVESDPSAVLKSLVDTKGDLIVATSDNTVARQAVGANDSIIVADSSQTNGLKWALPSVVTPFTKTGAQTVATGSVRFRIPFAAVIESVAATVGTAPTGASLIVDVNKNGTTIFTTQGNRPTIAISGNASSDAVPDVTAVAAGDYITVDVDQIGSTVAGSDLCVMLRYHRAA